MRLAIAISALLFASAPAGAEIYKCTAKYGSGSTMTLNLSTPIGAQVKSLAVLSPDADPKGIGKAVGFVSEGVIEYDRLGAKTTDQAILVITNRDPLIAFFQDPKRIASVRIDGKPPNAKVTYYDAWFAPNEIATGTCM